MGLVNLKETRKNAVERANRFIQEGLNAVAKGNLSEAVEIVTKALCLLKEADEQYLYAKTMNLLGSVYASIGNETMAIDCYLDGLDIAEEQEAYDLPILFYNNIGTRYQELGETQKAIYYFHKSQTNLKAPNIYNHERYGQWSMVNALNLSEAYSIIGRYKEAEEYLHHCEQILDTQAKEDFKYAYLISKSHLYMKTGREAYVREHIDDLLALSKEENENGNLVQNITELCDILLELNDYEHLKDTLEIFDDYIKEKEIMFYQTTSIGLWMKYYKAIGQKEEYNRLCVKYAELMEQEKIYVNKEKVAVIDAKIELREKESQRRRAEKQAMSDELTGLWNRYRLTKDCQKLFKIAKQEKQRVAFGILDIDCFKEQNDTYGHIQGDTSLKNVTEVLKRAVSGYGTVYRYGGDEFVIILTSGESEFIEKIAESIKRNLKKREIPNENSEVDKFLTLS